MPSLLFKPVITRAEKRQFLRLPWTLYRDDPNWVPPLRGNQREVVGYRPHPFYEDAEIQTFLALADGWPCGRIAAIVNHAHNRRYKERRGFFGFFESIDDAEVAAGLFDAARAWLAERGIQQVRGPMNPSMNYECGLLIEGFDTPPTFMMTYNPPYYVRLVEDYGFRKAVDMYSFWGHVEMLEGLDKKLDFVVAEAKRRFHLKMRKLAPSHFYEEVQLFLNIYNGSLGAQWGFVPLSKREIDHLAAGLRHLIVPEMTAVAEVDGRAIGAVFGLLDYNPIIKKIDGRLFPFGFLRLLSGRRKLTRVRMVATNVLPEYQRWGVGVVLLNRVLPDALAWGIKEGEFSWVMENNDFSRKSLERGGAIRNKTFRIYDYGPEGGDAPLNSRSDLR